MLHVDVTLEDCRLIVSRRDDGWHGTITDTMTGKSVPVSNWTDIELGSVLALGVGLGEAWTEHDDVVKSLYDEAERVCEGLLPGLRPIP